MANLDTVEKIDDKIDSLRKQVREYEALRDMLEDEKEDSYKNKLLSQVYWKDYQYYYAVFDGFNVEVRPHTGGGGFVISTSTIPTNILDEEDFVNRDVKPITIEQFVEQYEKQCSRVNERINGKV